MARQLKEPGPMFAVGDLVELKSGGPVMTVSAPAGAGVFCLWFRGGTLFNGSFPLETLVLRRRRR